MAAEAGTPPRAAPLAPIPLLGRLYGFGSIYGKTIRDSRLAFLMMTGLVAGLMLAVGRVFGTAYATEAARTEISNLVTDMPPVLAGLAGNPVNVGTLGGFIAWKYGPFFAFIAGLWSILALSSTLAGEARRGSLDFVAAAPFGKRRVALEKLGAHVTVMTLSMAILALATWAAGAIFATLPGDEIPLESAIGFALWVGLIGLVSGAVAFAVAPVVGRASAAGVAGAVMLGGYVLSGYAPSVPAFSAAAKLTWFHWTYDHVPLAGQYDWAALAAVALAAAVLFVVGVEAFARRDLGVMTGLPVPGLPKATLGLRGPVGRAFGDQLPQALAWGLGIGLFGFVIAAATKSFADELSRQAPSMVELIRSVFPGVDITTAGGFLQLVFVEIGLIVAGFAGATFVGKWASDETSGRLEMVLTAPLARGRWAIAGGAGALIAVAVMTALFAVGIGIGAAVAGSDVADPMAGAVVLGLYAAAMVGVGVAIGGLLRTSLAAELVAVIVVATFLVNLLAPALKLPDWVRQLALTAHLGQPMVGTWDVGGIIACLALAVGGVLLGAWGVARRDVG